MPRLLDLPPELIALTARYLPVDGLRNCRLSCKDLRDKVARVFENAYFKRRSVMLHPGSLGHLVDLSDTSWSTCVRSVVISIYRLSESGLQNSTRPKAYRHCLEKQTRFFHVGNAAQLLCTALSKLPNCRSIILEDKDEDDEDEYEDAVPWGFRRLSQTVGAEPVCALRHRDSNPSSLKDHDSFLKFALDIIIEAANGSKHIQKLDIRVGGSHEVDLHAMAPGDIIWSMKDAKSIQRRLTSLSLVIDPNRRRLGTPKPLESFLNSFQQLKRLRLQFFAPDPNFLFPKLSSSLKLSRLEVLELEGVSGISREELVTLLENHQTTLREVVIAYFNFKEPGAVPYLQKFCDKRRVQVMWHDCWDYKDLSLSPGHEFE